MPSGIRTYGINIVIKVKVISRLRSFQHQSVSALSSVMKRMVALRLNVFLVWNVILMQILALSHKVRRIDHTLAGQQVGADPDRTQQIMKFCPLLEVEVQPGDCLFFHCNLLHKAYVVLKCALWGIISTICNQVKTEKGI